MKNVPLLEIEIGLNVLPTPCSNDTLLESALFLHIVTEVSTCLC